MSISYSIMGVNSEGDSARIQNYLSSITSPPFLLLENMTEISFPLTFHPSRIPDICFIFEDTLLSCIDTVIDDMNAISPFTSIMILSKNEDRVFEAYAKNIVYFIRYSHLEEDLQTAITKYLYYLHILRPSYVSVTNSKVISVPYEEILYIDTYKNKLSLHLVDDTILEERKTLNAFYKSMPSQYFTFVSKSTIVNMMHIRAVTPSSLCLSNKHNLDISRSKKDDFFKAYRKYLFLLQ